MPPSSFQSSRIDVINTDDEGLHKLAHLIKELECFNHSKHVTQGSVFFDAGSVIHCQEALEKGAHTVVSTLKHSDLAAFKAHYPNANIYQTPCSRTLFALACAIKYPFLPHVRVCITGTNGKTSTLAFLRQLWHMAEKKAVTYGTLGLTCSPNLQSHFDALQNALKEHTASLVPHHINTLDPLRYHRLLHNLGEIESVLQRNQAQNMSSDGIYFGCEASSHGLHQRRIFGKTVTHGVWTNLTPEHLDYHGDMEAYFQAKKLLFTCMLAPKGVAVINIDDPFGQRLIRDIELERADIRVLTYSALTKSAHLYAHIQASDLHGTRLRIVYHETDGAKEELQVTLPLQGTFQVLNVLGALGVFVTSCAATLKNRGFCQLKTMLSALESPRGRLEHVGATPLGGRVFVDYAHTPDALKHALAALRASTTGHVYVLFGCGGDRDTSKRAVMGRVAQAGADYVILTDDNPRTEDPALIRAAVKEGCPKAYEVTEGRGAAIAFGVAQLKAHDSLLIAGKGHETVQIIGAHTQSFSDEKVARRCIDALSSPLPDAASA